MRLVKTYFDGHLFYLTDQLFDNNLLPAFFVTSRREKISITIMQSWNPHEFPSQQDLYEALETYNKYSWLSNYTPPPPSPPLPPHLPYKPYVPQERPSSPPLYLVPLPLPPQYQLVVSPMPPTLKNGHHRTSSLSALKSSISDCKKFFVRNYRKNPGPNKELTLSDFEDLRTIGRGSFGTVVIARLKETGSVFAIKVLNKLTIIEHDQIEHTKSEKRILRSIDHPFIVKMFDHFYDKANLFMVMEYCPGGDLSSLHRYMKCFTESTAQFYIAQVILAIEFLHELKIIYRDLKMENIMLDSDGFVKLVDFGLVKCTLGKTSTMCGTPCYMAPEMVLGLPYGESVDWWAMGVLMYEMVVGCTPFNGGNDLETFDSILKEQVSLPMRCSRSYCDLVYHLLTKNPQNRHDYVKRGSAGIKSHPWFKDVDWCLIFNKQVTPPLQSELMCMMEARQLDKCQEFPLQTSFSIPTDVADYIN